MDLKHHVIIIYKIPILFDLPSTRGLSEHAWARRFREDPFLRGCCFELLLMLMMLVKPLMLLKMMLIMKMTMIVLILDKVMLSSMMFQSAMSLNHMFSCVFFNIFHQVIDHIQHHKKKDCVH